MSVTAPPAVAALSPRPRGVQVRSGVDLEPPAGMRLVSERAGSSLRQGIHRAQRRCDALLGTPRPGGPVLRIRCRTEGSHWPALDADEGYALELGPDGGTLEAAEPWGVLHGLERLVQVLYHGGGHLPALRIEDAPGHPWRGLLLDLARHFLGLDALLRTLDAMAALGLNVLHLHLNDDQGFALECPRRPALHRRSGVHGFLSLEASERLVVEAAARGIRVVPELDVPGHAGAVVHACPELAAGPPPERLPRAFGPSRHALDPTLPGTWDLLDDLLDDLVALFPDPWLHLGGDEVHPEVYAFDDERRRAWAAERGLTDPQAVQAWFTGELVARAAARGRRVVGWDEVLHPDAPEALAVQCWRSADTLEAALAAGHDALFSAGWYLDLFYPARVHYAFDPGSGGEALRAAEEAVLAEPSLAPVRAGIEGVWRMAADLRTRPSSRRGRLLGGEACLWGELVTAELLDVRLLGRLPAVAERLWSPPERCDAADFRRRLPGVLAFLEATTPCRPLTGMVPGLLRLGVRVEELEPVQAFLSLLEPLRWYRRLLGPAALDARLAGEGGPGRARPRDADSPLADPADLIAPESLALEALADALARPEARTAWLRGRAAVWRRLPDTLAEPFARLPALAVLAPLAEALPPLADALDRWLDAGPARPPTVLSTAAPVPEAAETELALVRVLAGTTS